MSSSQNSAALGRARSLRKPTTRSDTAATDQNNGSSQQQNTSPSRLPAKPSATGTGTGTLRRAAGEVRGSRPLSGVFGRGTSGSTTSSAGVGGRQVSTSTNPDSSTRLARAPSIRQASSASTNTESSTASGTSRLTRAASIRQLSTSSAKSGVSATSEGSSIAPPRRPTVTTAEQQPTPLSRRPTVSESTSTSSRRPTTSSGVPPRRIPSTATPISHSRAKSSVTALTNTTILRPPSSTSQASTATSTSTERTDRSKPPTTRSTAAPLHKRAPSHPTTTTTKGNQSTPGMIARTRSLKLSGPSATNVKPDFSTHQQHFSPLKNPHLSKPLTSAILAPPSPSKLTGNIAISAETARLQTELLQLSLLHASAGSVKVQWEESAYKQLQARFHEVVELEGDVLKLENRVGEGNAVRELVEWGRGGLEERVRVLDQVIGLVWVMTEPCCDNNKGGRYVRVVRQFERWLGRVEGVMAGRGEDGKEEELVGEIGGDWKEEVGGLRRKVNAIRRDLDGIVNLEGNGEEQGNLGRVLRGVKELVEGVVSEIGVMEGVEREVREREMEWVRGFNRREEEEGEVRRRPAGAVWRAF
ncbi:hypothetical protein QBC40DRAFT_313347 [Triangularia verruculosa]|uniref:Uncharacterized protein n=1 Tax=Triangularia verruculosa TaxID=2587418 RepID=A0AAN6XBE3_9PEZI|nr:hypothetical protein QBC40DRAFT_313347 [Triangularia verruculosa]